MYTVYIYTLYIININASKENRDSANAASHPGLRKLQFTANPQDFLLLEDSSPAASSPALLRAEPERAKAAALTADFSVSLNVAHHDHAQAATHWTACSFVRDVALNPVGPPMSATKEHARLALLSNFHFKGSLHWT